MCLPAELLLRLFAAKFEVATKKPTSMLARKKLQIRTRRRNTIVTQLRYADHCCLLWTTAAFYTPCLSTWTTAAVDT